MEKLNLNVNAPEGVVTIRQGDAPEIKQQPITDLVGNIHSVSAWITERNSLINKECAVIIVNKDKKLIHLIEDQYDYFGTKITGRIELSDKFLNLGINTGKEYTNYDLAKVFRMNRTLFESKEKALSIVNDLKTFEAKVEQTIKEMKDNRGNYSSQKAQAVESNVPESITLQVPIFKGMETESINVEFDINPNNLTFSLVSPDANDIIENSVNDLIDKEIKLIEELTPGIVILYQ